MSSQPRNHVRILRRRNSLSQQDLAFLLGSKDKSKICRYEQGHRIPSLRTAVALATILNTTVPSLFSAVQRGAYRDAAERVAKLQSAITERYSKGRMPALVSREMRWLEECRARLNREHFQPT